MFDTQSSRRETVTALCSIGLGALAVPTTAGARSSDGSDRCGGSSAPVSPDRAESLAERSGTFLATVDRIVDGEHVVVLLEDGGEVVDQVVLSAADHPDVEAGDVLLVVLEDDEPLSIRPVSGEGERRREEQRDRFDDLSEPLENADENEDG